MDAGALPIYGGACMTKDERKKLIDDFEKITLTMMETVNQRGVDNVSPEYINAVRENMRYLLALR